MRMVEAANTRDIVDDSRLDQFVMRLYAESTREVSTLRRIGTMVVIDEPRDFEVVARHPGVFEKDYSAFSNFGRSRLSENGKEWEIRRQITQGAYIAIASKGSRPAIDAVFVDRVARIDTLSLERFHQAFLEATTINFHRAFGIDVDPATPMRILDFARPMLRRMQRLALVGGTSYEFAQSRARSGLLMTEVTRAAAQLPWLRDLTAEINQQGKQLAGFSAVEEYLFNMLAGIETAASASTWVIDRLGLFPDLQERLAKEILENPESSALNIFISETLRRFPPIPFVLRRPCEDIKLGPNLIRKGECVFISIIGLHHNRDFWTAPNKFHPDRPEFAEDTYHRYAFAPFITGPRVCGGAKLARLEIAAAVKAFLARFRSRRTSHDANFRLAIALRPVASRETLAITAV